MRASVLVLGPLARPRGPRPRLAARAAARSARGRSTCTCRPSRRWAPSIEIEHGYVEARAERLRGAEVHFDTVTVTGTENMMMAACLADGETVIRNAACEPEVDGPRRRCSRAMGACIEGAGTPDDPGHGPRPPLRGRATP